MGHIHGERDARFHDPDGHHIAPVAVEHHSDTLGYPVVHGRDLEQQERDRAAYQRHLALHEERGDVVHERAGAERGSDAA